MAYTDLEKKRVAQARADAQPKRRASALERSKKWHAEHPDADYSSHLKRKYGISMADYQELYKACGGKCQICKRDSRRLHVDHDHVTGELRGLLCGSCNRGLGLFQDNPELLTVAKDYLTKYMLLRA